MIGECCFDDAGVRKVGGVEDDNINLLSYISKSMSPQLQAVVFAAGLRVKVEPGTPLIVVGAVAERCAGVMEISPYCTPC